MKVDPLPDIMLQGGELTQRWVLRKALHTHGLARNHVHNGRISRLQELGVVFKLLPGATVNLFLELCEFAGNVRSVAVQHGGVASTDLTRVVQDDHLDEAEAG